MAAIKVVVIGDDKTAGQAFSVDPSLEAVLYNNRPGVLCLLTCKSEDVAAQVVGRLGDRVKQIGDLPSELGPLPRYWVFAWDIDKLVGFLSGKG